jgi:hypothetical protein
MAQGPESFMQQQMPKFPPPGQKQ